MIKGFFMDFSGWRFRIWGQIKVRTLEARVSSRRILGFNINPTFFECPRSAKFRILSLKFCQIQKFISKILHKFKVLWLKAAKFRIVSAKLRFFSLKFAKFGILSLKICKIQNLMVNNLPNSDFYCWKSAKFRIL